MWMHLMKGHLRILGATGMVLVFVWLVAGCAHPRGQSSPRDLFSRIEIGMDRAKVEALLGAPTVLQISPDTDVWYLPPPRLEPYESPYAPGTIGIAYTPEGIVASKRLNPQYRQK